MRLIGCSGEEKGSVIVQEILRKVVDASAEKL